MRVDAAPDRSFGGDQHRIGLRSEPMPRKAVSGLGCRGQSGEAEPVEVRRPGGLIGEDPLRLRRQTGDQRGGQSASAHVIERRVVQYEIGMSGA